MPDYLNAGPAATDAPAGADATAADADGTNTTAADTAMARIADRPWGAILLTAALAALCLVASVERFWRTKGHRPTIIDSPALWSKERERIAGAGSPPGVALLGTSRMLTGFSTDLFRERYPGVPLSQLAIPECAPLELLADLAGDESFRGTVLCELSEPAFVPGVSEKYAQAEYLDFYRRRWTWNERLNLRANAAVEERFCCRGPHLGIDRVLVRLLDGESLPSVSPVVMQFDRRQRANYGGPGVHRARALTVNKLKQWYQTNLPEAPSPGDWLAHARRAAPLVRAIESRGGRVVFLRFPSTGATWELESRHFPKEQYWDRLSEALAAVTVHFRDVPRLADTECPDTSHIDVRDSDRFTGDLLDELERLGVAFGSTRAAFSPRADNAPRADAPPERAALPAAPRGN